MIRELTCVLIGAYSAVLVVGLMRLAQGQAAYEGFLDAMRSPVGIAFHAVAFVFALYHTASWFNVTPKAMLLQIGERRLPGGAIIGAHYAGWLVVSAVVLFLAGG
jgi:fumarate reductase subunit C